MWALRGDVGHHTGLYHQPNSNGLQRTSDGLQPNREIWQWTRFDQGETGDEALRAV